MRREEEERVSVSGGDMGDGSRALHPLNGTLGCRRDVATSLSQV